MMEGERAQKDTRSGRATRLAIQSNFWPLWILLTTVGYAAGMGIDDELYRAAGPTLSGIVAGVANLALYGAIVGGLSGALQALLLRGRVERRSLWLLACTLGGAAGFVLGGLSAGAAGAAIGLQLDVYTAGGIIQFVFGAFAGAGIGFVQWLILRRTDSRAGVWVPASILGLTLGFSVPLGLLEAVKLPFRGVWFGLFAGLLLSLAQWIWTRGRVMRTKRET